ncbi:MAG TPA: ATP-binding protein [Roseiflexaceae bacterium]|nr:ATP-binding protein [Roseiflexaceae bacterium]
MTDNDTIRLDLPASFKHLNMLGPCIQALLEHVEGLAEPEISAYNIQLAVHEVCTNIVEHAYAGRENGRIAIAFTLAEPRKLLVELRDTGHIFDPADAPDPDLDNAHVRGYGLFLVHSLMDDVSYQALPTGNCWRLTKNV